MARRKTMARLQKRIHPGLFEIALRKLTEITEFMIALAKRLPLRLASQPFA